MYSRREFLHTGIGATAWWAARPAFSEAPDITGMTLKKASDLIRSKTVSPVDLTQACLKRIDKYNSAIECIHYDHAR